MKKKVENNNNKKSQNRSLDQRKINFNETMKEYNFSLTLF